MSRTECGSDEALAMEEILEVCSYLNMNEADKSVKDVADGDLEDGGIASSTCPSSFSDDSGFSDFNWREFIPESLMTTENGGTCECLCQESEAPVEGNCDSEHECDIVTEGTHLYVDHNAKMVKEGSCTCIETSEIEKKGVLIVNNNYRDKDKMMKVNCNCGYKNKVNEKNFDCNKNINRQNTEVSDNCKNYVIKEGNERGTTCSLVKESLDTSTYRLKMDFTEVNNAAENSAVKPGCILWNTRHTNTDVMMAGTELNFPTNGSERRNANSIGTLSSHKTVGSVTYRAQDLNNNEASTRNISSYLMPAPFKLQDCFQEQGLLSLIACIIYTLILMFIVSILGKLLDSFKSSIGTHHLKKIRRNIVQYSRTRMYMASG